MALNLTRLARHVFYVEAIRVTAENMSDVAEWCRGEIKHSPVVNDAYIQLEIPRAKSVHHTRAFVGDWVLGNGMGWKAYNDRALFKDFHRVTEDVCGDHKAANVGCRSLTDYKVIVPTVVTL